MPTCGRWVITFCLLFWQIEQGIHHPKYNDERTITCTNISRRARKLIKNLKQVRLNEKGRRNYLHEIRQQIILQLKSMISLTHVTRFSDNLECQTTHGSDKTQKASTRMSKNWISSQNKKKKLYTNANFSMHKRL